MSPQDNTGCDDSEDNTSTKVIRHGVLIEQLGKRLEDVNQRQIATQAKIQDSIAHINTDIARLCTAFMSIKWLGGILIALIAALLAAVLQMQG